MSEYEIRAWEPGDEDGILATFNAVFAQGDPGFRPRTRAEWEWAYTGNPAGIRVWVATCEGQIAAHYASQPSRVRIEGTDRIFGQIIDSMVHPDHARGLKRPGLFVETAQRMLAATCGPDRDLVTYGWPIGTAWRIGKSFLRYEMVRTQSFLFEALPEPGGAAADGALPDGVEELERFGASALALYDRCAEEWEAGIVRDASFLDWRFVERPGVRYRRLGVRDGDGALAGYAVYREASWPGPHTGLLMDWLVPADDVRTGELLRDALRAAAVADGARTLLAIFPEWATWFARFQEWGWLVHPSDYLMSGRNNLPRYDMAWLRDHWWYTQAEIDFV